MDNNAASLTGARILFGSTVDNTFSADLLAQIIGENSGNLTFASDSINFTGAVAIAKTLKVTGAITASAGIVGNISSATNAQQADLALEANKLKFARQIALAGDIVGTQSFDGSANVSLTTEINKIKGVNVWVDGNDPTGTSELKIDACLTATKIKATELTTSSLVIPTAKPTTLVNGSMWLA